MSQLALPPHVQRRIDLERRQKHEAMIWRNVSAQDPLCRKYTALLQRFFGEGLAIVKANDTVWDPVPLRPGFYHLLQKPQDEAIMATVIQRDGEYAEPGDWMFDTMNRGNLRERRVRDQVIKQEREDYEAGERELAEANENRRERLSEIVTANTRVQISMNDSVPWSQNVAGRRK